MKKLLVTSAAAVALLGSAAILVAPAESKQPVKSDTYRQMDLFVEVFERVRSEYVEDVTDEQLVEAAIDGMLTSLDPHSSFLNRKNFQDMQVQTRGEFGGLGIEVTQENGVVKVVSPIDDTPAFRAGVQPGDYITHLNDEPIVGLGLNEAVEKMRGPVGTDIKVTIRRGEGTEPIQLSLTRAVVRVQSVRYRVEGDIGYIRVSSFNEQTQVGLDKAIAAIKQQLGPKLIGYVLDLRNNPGGLLDQAISVSDTFLDRGEIVSTRGRGAEVGDRFNAKQGDATGGAPVVVLVNGGSASASEIVAGALQDHKRAIVLGTQSFGKGSVQTIIPLQGHGAMRLTTARYFTPSGKSIQQLGITPDIEVQPARVEEITQGQRRREADLPHALSNPTNRPGAQGTPQPNAAPGTPTTTPAPAAPGAGPQVQAPQAPGAPGQPTTAAAPAGAPGATPATAQAGQPGTVPATGPDGQPFDYQLARALDLLRGVSLFAQGKTIN